MNHPRRLNAKIHAEMDELTKLGVLTPEQADTVKERYPTTPGDFMAIVRSFTALGALTAMAGMVVLVRAHLNWWFVSEAGLAALCIALLAAGIWLRLRKSMPRLGESLEFIGAVALQGLTVVLAIHHSTGSKNWPALVGVDTVLLFLLAYLLANRLILWYACANFFFYFGAETGYMSGWGCYWLGMTYPVRFLAVGCATLGLSWLHGLILRGHWTTFCRVYAHFGMLVLNLALWFLSLFGYYENYDTAWDDVAGERLIYSLLWALVCGAALYAGNRTGLKLLRGYGITFLIINLYTFYFQFVASNSGELWFLHMLLIGGSLLGLGFMLERRRKADATKEDDTPDPGHDAGMSGGSGI